MDSLNADYIDSQYRRWKADPNSVSIDWQFFFKGFEFAGSKPVALPASPSNLDLAEKQAAVEGLIRRYRDLGHLLACMDPLSACPTDHPLLSLEAFELLPQDLERTFLAGSLFESGRGTLKEIIGRLRRTYCRSIGVEYMHLQDPKERGWLQQRMESCENRPDLNHQEKRHIFEKLCESAVFESFFNKKYIGVTRFSLEGGNGVIPLLDTIVEQMAASGTKEIILGMAHRGRLNVQANILKKPAGEIFAEFESCYDPDQLVGSGDVKYHNGYLSDMTTFNGQPIRIFLVNNPSHLEAVNPVVQGIVRARQELIATARSIKVIPILIHGDAAFAGQGIVFETLNMSQLKGYETGGTLHIIINNQIGYTTLPEDARSTRYSTDVAKMLMVPIFHVHGENPEAIYHVAKLAAEYRNAFGKDVVIDLICYRRYGHNEGDEPYFTQPTMYDRIKKRPSLHRIYADQLINENIISNDRLKAVEADLEAKLAAVYDEIHGSSCSYPLDRFFENWQGYHGNYTFAPLKTEVDKALLRKLAAKINQVPDGFTLHPKLKTLLSKRLNAVKKGTGIDWANAEALAFAALINQGVPIRLSGQDVGRGTFSQRHSELMDRKSGAKYIPLNHLNPQNGPMFMVHNSLLAEAGVLGFEYGYSMIRPEVLTLWEAQFGDFANNAQAISDLFIAAGQSKWERLSGLTMLLPHGFEGLGPEHSSARLERFLQLCAQENIQVCNLSTPAQYFHLLRRQAKASYRKPLILMTPKSLLRHPMAVSALNELAAGHFQPILDDPNLSISSSIKKIVLCSGKIYYQLQQRHHELGTNSLSIIRIEQLYPFPKTQFEELVQKYPKDADWIWVQEEPANMGAWTFIRPRIEAIIHKSLTYVGRQAAASPATGFPKIYKKEQNDISDQAVGPYREAPGVTA
jgi:2-oxoglutarate dehydrogenase E1 component